MGPGLSQDMPGAWQTRAQSQGPTLLLGHPGHHTVLGACLLSPTYCKVLGDHPVSEQRTEGGLKGSRVCLSPGAAPRLGFNAPGRAVSPT